jgi:integrase
MVFVWERFLRISGWGSGYPCVNNLLKYLGYRKIGSEASRRIYCYVLYMFCRHTDRAPDEMVTLKKGEIENLMQSFGYKKKERGCSSRTINVLLSDLKTFFSLNGFKNENELDVEFFYQPARARTRPEYIPTLEEALKMAECAKTLRDKTIILMLASSGLRNSTLRAIRYGDIREELECGEDNVLIRVYPDMKKLVASGCKGNVEYFSFTSKKTTDILRLYVAQKLDKVGEIRDEDPLFSSEYNQLPREERFRKPFSDRQLQVIVKRAAKDAKIKEWKAVTPHCLRKTYETLLRSRLKDGSRLDIQTQIYLMGHTLPGGLGPYFDARVEDLRKEYSKLVFSPSDEKLTKAIEVLKAASDLLRSYGAQSTPSEAKEPVAHDPNDASKAIQDFVEEIRRTDDVCRETAANPDSPSERKDQGRIVTSQDKTTQPQAESAGKRMHSDSHAEVPKIVIRKSKIPTKNPQNPSTKQTALDLFVDPSILREDLPD